jgi:hypothetical protein
VSVLRFSFFLTPAALIAKSAGYQGAVPSRRVQLLQTHNGRTF